MAREELTTARFCIPTAEPVLRPCHAYLPQITIERLHNLGVRSHDRNTFRESESTVTVGT
jgi:hypothetical protein